MKKLSIAITKASLQSFSVSLNEDGTYRVEATIGLMTDGGRKITSYTIYTQHWNKEQEFELPLTCISPIREMAKELEGVVTKHCQDSVLQLSAPEYAGF